MMKKVLLLMPTYYADAQKTEVYRLVPPLGLGYIASSIREFGCEVKIFDVMGRDSEITSVIENYSPDLIGVSCMTTFYPEFAKTVNYIRNEVKYDGLLLAGGPHITIEPEKTLKQLPLNACVVGEGEKTMQDIIKANDLSSVKGLYTRRGFTGYREPIENLDEIPFPAYDLFDLERYNDVTTPMISSRGCPYDCAFCSSKHQWGRKVRFRDPENVVREIEFLKQKHGRKEFIFFDDTFVINKGRIRKFADLISNENISFSCNGRIDLMSDELLSNLRRAKCNLIYYGIESGVQRICDNINKAISIKQVSDVVRRTVDFGFHCHLYFMLSLPGENLDDMKQTLKLAEEMHYKYNCSIEFQLMRIYPGTPLSERVNLDIQDWSESIHPDLRYPNVPVYLELQFDEVYGFWLEARKKLIGDHSPTALAKRFIYSRYKKTLIAQIYKAIKHSIRRILKGHY